MIELNVKVYPLRPWCDKKKENRTGHSSGAYVVRMHPSSGHSIGKFKQFFTFFEHPG